MKTKTLNNRELYWLLLIVAVVTIVPFLGISDFHTKGEPREAVVAYSMLEQGNWILPSNNGGDIPYKPPFFHWCIALASLLTGGRVTEFSSRLPSAIALIAMSLAIFKFYSRHRGNAIAMLTAIVTLTAFEIHRAGPNCRVDMMLTALTVGALISFYSYYERGLKGVPWLAILLMSAATLTKGPVGSIIPSLCFGVFLLLKRVNFFRAFFLLAAWGLISFILPLCWYIAAYQQGGQEFLNLVMDENFGRMTSTMTYDVHINPWYYNVITLLSGFLPWTLLALFSLFSLKKLHGRQTWKELFKSIPRCSEVTLFSIVNILIIFIFYCIPSGKRSVYLMPLYPFLAYFLALLCLKLTKVEAKALKAYGSLLAGLGMILTCAVVAIKTGLVPDGIFGHGRHAAQNAAMMHEIGSVGWPGFMLTLLPAIFAILWFRNIYSNRKYTDRLVWGICVLTFGLYLAVDGAIQPRIFAAKSQRPVAAEIEEIAPESEGILYEYILSAEHAAGDPVHFFELDFYLNDRIHNFLKEKPREGFLVITDEDAASQLPRFQQEGYQFFPLYESTRPILYHRPAQLYRFILCPKDLHD